MQHTTKDWWMATRPWSFPASAMPVVVILAYLWSEGESIDWLNGACALVGMILFQAGSNVWSDYYDYRKGVDAADTFGVKILTSGFFTPHEIRCFGLLLFGAAALIGMWMVVRTGLCVGVIGLCGTVCAMCYPWFKYRALGDVVIFLSYALLPAWGTACVATGAWHGEVTALIVPVGLITVAILHANNMRDIETDSRAGISTLAMITGRRKAAIIYSAEVLGACAWIPVCVAGGIYSPWTLLVMLALPGAWGNARAAWRMVKEGGIAAADLDERTARLQLLFSLLFALSFVVERLVG